MSIRFWSRQRQWGIKAELIVDGWGFKANMRPLISLQIE
jgi:hypothetical protein